MAISASLGETREVHVGGATLRYREVGEGTPLLFLHGLLVNGDLWRKVVPLLSDRFRCITPDLPLGSHELPVESRDDLSPRGVAGMVAEFIGALRLRDVTVVANDTGGAITQLLVTEHPGLVSRVVLTPCDCFENFLPPAFKMLQICGRSSAFWWLAGQSMRLRPLLRTPLAFGLLMHGAPPREIADSWLGPVRRSKAVRGDVAAFTRRIDSRDTVAAGARLHAFAGEVLLAWAASDRGFPRTYARRLAEAFGEKARLEFIEGSRVFVPEDQPAALARLIAEFVGAARPTAATAAAPDEVMRAPA
jgi:pimeloyl-ACP methyl ester carboxylesterase